MSRNELEVLTIICFYYLSIMIKDWLLVYKLNLESKNHSDLAGILAPFRITIHINNYSQFERDNMYTSCKFY